MHVRTIAHRNRLAIILRVLAEVVASFVFGGAVVCWVAGHAGPEEGLALIHVTEGNVDVHIGDHTFHIDDRRYGPIECTLGPGRHTLLMKRGDEVLCREEFDLERGGEIVLTAWDQVAWARAGGDKSKCAEASPDRPAR
jgi:hypothetical protein